MSLTLRARLRLAAVAALLGAAALGACSADSMTAPLVPGTPTESGIPGDTAGVSDTALVQVTALARNASLNNEYVASVLVTPDSGGWLEIPDAGLLVYAPPGAVADTITIWAKAIAGSTVAYEFGPHGTMFAQPVYVWQDLRSTEWALTYDRTANMEAGYFKNRSQVDTTAGTAYVGELRPAVAVYSVNKNNVVFTVSHFSGYLLSTGRIAQ